MANKNEFNNVNEPPPYIEITTGPVGGGYYPMPQPNNYSNVNQGPGYNQHNTNNQIPNAPVFIPPPIRIEPKNMHDAERGYANHPQGGNPNTNNNQWGNFGNGLSDKVARIKFIRKVYMIISVQLIFSFAIVSIFVTVPAVKTFAKSSAGFALYIVSYVLFIGLIITFSICSCCKGLRKVPYNYILLGAITITMTYMMGMISAYHEIASVFIAVGVTLVVTVGVTLFACQTRFDFTNCWMVMLCLSLAFLGFGIAVAITSAFKSVPILQAVYGGLGALLMSLFLAIDTQMLMGNKRFSYNPEDYVEAALQIYLDICYIFLYILQIFGSANK